MNTVQPSAPADDWTVRRVLEWTIGYLKQHGSESPRLDAEVLLAYAWGCPRILLYTRYDDALPPEIRSRMRDLVRRRAAAEPVAYLVGKREFFSLDFEVTPAVLIPRPDTETLIVEALALLKGRTAPQVLDLCTGSGCIGISIARNARDSQVTAIDISPEAIAVAQRNADRLQVADRVRFLTGDLFAPLSDGTKFDVIVTNPPYVTTGELAGLSADVRLHEPHLALDGGVDGLDLLRTIIATAPQFLVPGGWLYLECSPEQVPAVIKLLEATSSYVNIDAIRDLSQQPRVVRAQCPSPSHADGIGS
ncbi:MAG: peptide chain release factor N(5)-glutamine methyltransferase [Planctomycetaceae bacterium]